MSDRWRDLVDANDLLVLAWLRDFERSAPFSALAGTVQKSLPGAARVMAYCFTRRWSRVESTAYPLTEMTAEDAIDVLTEQLPHTVSAVDGDAIIEGLVELLIWAAKAGRIKNRDVEYACRKGRHDAAAAMKHEAKWAPGKSMVLRALHDGVDAADLERVREHAIGTGLDPGFVDEFLPPGPTYVGEGRWLWMYD